MTQLSLHEKVLVITALKEQLNKLKGKAILTETVSLNPIDPELLKVDVAPLVPKLRKNRTAHTDYIRHTQEEAATIREIVESERLLSPLNTYLDYVWRTFTIVGNVCLLTRIAIPTIMPPREPIPIVNSMDKPVVTLVVQIDLWYLDSGCSKHITEDRSQLINFVQKFLGTVKFGNDHVAKIIDLEVAFRQHTCFIRNLDGVDLLTGSWGNNLYTLSLQDMMASLPICLLSKASKPMSWLWHHRLSHLNFGAINHLASVNGKKYILVIVDDYSRFTWVKFLRSKDETLNFIIKFLKMIQVRLKVPVRRIRTDNGTEFVNQTLLDYYEEVGISHETSVARSPQQNGVVERRNHTLIEAARMIENLGKLQPKADIGIFIGYAPTKKAFQIYNRRTRRIMETIHVDFDELTAMASEQCSSGHVLNEMTHGKISSGLVQTSSPSTSYVPPLKND
nr:hypothetical protein [Tanacetum cinerariifolium]